MVVSAWSAWGLLRPDEDAGDLLDLVGALPELLVVGCLLDEDLSLGLDEDLVGTHLVTQF